MKQLVMGRAPAARGEALDRPTRVLSVRAWITLASVGAVLPLLVLSLALTATIAASRQAEAFEELKRRALAGAASVDAELDAARVLLRSMAASPAAHAGDLPRLHEFAQRAHKDHPDASAISLTRRGGEVVFSSLRPLGESLARSRAAQYEGPVFEQGASVVTPMFIGSVTGKPIVAVAQPLRVSGELRYAVRVTLYVQAFSRVLEEQVFPPSWTVALIDQNDIILARSREAERFVGKPATESLRAAIHGGQAGPVRAVTKDGVDVVLQVAPVGKTGWHLAIGVPAAQLRDAWMWPLLLQLGVGVACVLLGLWASRRVASMVRDELHSAMPRAQAPLPPPGPVREVNAVRERLTEAAFDPLTNLVTRSAFGDAVVALQTRLSSPDRLALLYVDLDDFKPINDRLGHAAGDRVLAEVGAAIRAELRPGDLAARWGGDEFVVCLHLGPDQSLPTALGIAQRLIDRVCAVGSDLSCSVGVALGEKLAPLDDLLAAADAAMLRAKRSGKGRVVAAQDR